MEFAKVEMELIQTQQKMWVQGELSVKSPLKGKTKIELRDAPIQFLCFFFSVQIND